MNHEDAYNEWKLASEALRGAETLVENGLNTSCVSRAYYAMLHASKAALAMKKVETGSHTGVARMFGRHLIQSGEIERRWGRELGKALEARTMADYGIRPTWSDEEARAECERATRFTERIRRYLADRGIPESKLEALAGKQPAEMQQPRSHKIPGG